MEHGPMPDMGAIPESPVDLVSIFSSWTTGADLHELRGLLNTLAAVLLIHKWRKDGEANLADAEMVIRAINQYFRAEVEARLMNIQDEFIRAAERVFYSLPPEVIWSLTDEYLVVDLKSLGVRGVFKSRVEAHRFFLDSHLDPRENYLRKAKMTPLLV